MIHIHGIEPYQTSVTHDNLYLKKFCSRNNYQLSSPSECDWLISVWWNTTKINPQKKYIIYISNFIKLENKKFCSMIESMNKINPNNIFWICPSIKQKRELTNFNLNTTFCPFYIHDCYYDKDFKINKDVFDEKFLFYNDKVIDRKTLSKILSENLIAGSFQRDTEGANLTKPKWQKGPENIISLLKNSKNKKDTVLLLCGSRRHYIINECKKHNINYLYVCNNKPKGDDIAYNMFSQEETYFMYKNINLYICGSVLEGGPKSIIESAHLNIPIFSHDIGLASDYIQKENIYNSFESDAFDSFISNMDSFSFNTDFPSLPYKDKTLSSIINEN